MEDEFSVKLEILRGLNNQFYYALRDEGAASDSLYKITFTLNKENNGLIFDQDVIPAPCTGEILALELDVLNSNDVESYYHDNDNLDEWKDKLDRIFIIDGRLNLFKIVLEREVKVLTTVSLNKFKTIQDSVETLMRGCDFIRISVTDRCFTMFGKTYNYHTGFCWDYFYNSSGDEEDRKSKILLQESLPTSSLQIALFERDGKQALILKNEASSRKRCTFDCR